MGLYTKRADSPRPYIIAKNELNAGFIVANLKKQKIPKRERKRGEKFRLFFHSTHFQFSGYVPGPIFSRTRHINPDGSVTAGRNPEASARALNYQGGSVAESRRVSVAKAYDHCGNPSCEVKQLKKEVKKKVKEEISDLDLNNPSKKLKLCNGCKKAYYCSRHCQKKMWKTHKKVC